MPASGGGQGTEKIHAQARDASARRAGGQQRCEMQPGAHGSHGMRRRRAYPHPEHIADAQGIRAVFLLPGFPGGGFAGEDSGREGRARGGGGTFAEGDRKGMRGVVEIGVEP